jgi:hypothetical protein
VIFCLLLIVVSFVGSYIYAQVKSSYNPQFSYLFEDYINSPSEQVQSRLNIIDAVLKGTYEKSGDQIDSFLSNLTSFDLEGLFTITYSGKTTNSPVLGLNIKSGSVDEKKLNEMLSASEGEINVYMHSINKITDNAMLLSQTDAQIRFESAGNEIGAEMEVKTFLYPSSNNSYIKINKFPDNPYLLLSPFLNKWIKFDQTELSSLNTNSNDKPLTFDALTGQLKEQIPIFNTFLKNETVSKSLTLAPKDKVSGVDVKCYNLHIDEGNYEAIIYEFYNVQGYTLEQQPLIDPNLALLKSDIKFCFDSQLLLRKISITSIQDDTKGNLTLEGQIRLNSFNQAYAILEPDTNVINYKDLKFDEITPMKFNFDKFQLLN